MRLYEHKGKEIFSQFKVPVPQGFLVTDSSFRIAELRFPVAIKAQVLAGGRGKMGGIRFVSNPIEAKKAVDALIGADIGGFKVKKILVEEKIDISRELYASISLCRDLKAPIIMFSAEGGMEVEEIDEKKIFQKAISPLIGLQPYIVRNLLKKIDLDGDLAKQCTHILFQLYNVFNNFDAELVEINPLAITRNREVVAVDSKIIVDNNALFRHPDLKGLDRGLTKFEQKGLELGVSGAVEIGGDIALITNGAGCLLEAIDIVQSFGGSVAAAIDLGGINTFDVNTIEKCISLVMSLNPKAILFIAFPMIGRWDIFVRGMLNALSQQTDEVSVVLRLKGNKAHSAKRLLKASEGRIIITYSFMEACKKAAKAACAY